MENMGETRFLHLTGFWCAHGYSLQLPTYSLHALGSGHAEFIASQNIHVTLPPLTIPLSPVWYEKLFIPSPFDKIQNHFHSIDKN